MGLTGGKRVLAVLLPRLLQRQHQQRQRHPLLYPLPLLLLCLGARGPLPATEFGENDWQQQQQDLQPLTRHRQDPQQQQQQQDHQQQWQQQGVRLSLWGSLLPTPLRPQQQQQQRTPLMRPQSTSPHPGVTSQCVQ